MAKVAFEGQRDTKEQSFGFCAYECIRVLEPHGFCLRAPSEHRVDPIVHQAFARGAQRCEKCSLCSGAWRTTQPMGIPWEVVEGNTRYCAICWPICWGPRFGIVKGNPSLVYRIGNWVKPLQFIEPVKREPTYCLSTYAGQEIDQMDIEKFC